MTFEVLHRVKSRHLIRLPAQIKWQKLEETLCLSTYGKDVKSITEKQMVWDVTMVQNSNFVKANKKVRDDLAEVQYCTVQCCYINKDKNHNLLPILFVETKSCSPYKAWKKCYLLTQSEPWSKDLLNLLLKHMHWFLEETAVLLLAMDQHCSSSVCIRNMCKTYSLLPYLHTKYISRAWLSLKNHIPKL